MYGDHFPAWRSSLALLTPSLPTLFPAGDLISKWSLGMDPWEVSLHPSLRCLRSLATQLDLRRFKIRFKKKKIASTEQKENSVNKIIHLKRKRNNNNTNNLGAKQEYLAEN